MQQMWAFMQTMQQSISNLHLDMSNRMNAFDRRLDEVETHAAAGHHYARRGVMNDPNFEDDPPTPPHVRRAAIAREAEIAQQRAAAQAAQAAQEAEAAPQEEEGDDEEEEESDNAMSEED